MSYLGGRAITRNHTVRCRACGEWFRRRFPCKAAIVRKRCPACGVWSEWSTAKRAPEFRVLFVADSKQGGKA